MKYQHFTAISQLLQKLGDSLVMTEELLDSALARQCTEFVPGIYHKLQVDYLDDTEMVLMMIVLL